RVAVLGVEPFGFKTLLRCSQKKILLLRNRRSIRCLAFRLSTLAPSVQVERMFGAQTIFTNADRGGNVIAGRTLRGKCAHDVPPLPWGSRTVSPPEFGSLFHVKTHTLNVRKCAHEHLGR